MTSSMTMTAADLASRQRVRVRQRVGYGCLAVYGVAWLLAGVHPWHPRDWLLENLLVVLSLPCLILLQRGRAWGIGTNAALLAFFLLHSIGAHYTYAQVPYRQLAHALFQLPLDPAGMAGRNHYDRLVHFMYGLLVQPAVRALLRAIPMRVWIRELACIQCIVATSALYELIEWAAVLIAAPDLGAAYLGTQGDVWDAHKDMLLALIGACLNSALYLGARVVQARTANRRRPAPPKDLP